MKIEVRHHPRRTKRKITEVRHHPRVIKRPKYKVYKGIYKRAKEKGYKVPKLTDDGPTVVDEINIPETFEYDGFVYPSNKKPKGYLIAVDDDAKPITKKKTFAHELGHIDMYERKERPHTEERADEIGADILDMPVKEFEGKQSVVIKPKHKITSERRTLPTGESYTYINVPITKGMTGDKLQKIVETKTKNIEGPVVVNYSI